jgi:acyl-CoA thioesterase II
MTVPDPQQSVSATPGESAATESPPSESAATESAPGLQFVDGIPAASNPQEALETVLAVIDVQLADEGSDVFVGTSYRPPWGRIFGGQVLAQSLVAAAKTVDESRPVHSLHAYFLRAGDPDEPIRFDVERLRDGRSFSARRTQAVQRGKPILSMISSFQEPADGLDHQVEMPAVPGPDDLPSLEEEYGDLPLPMVQQLLRGRPVELRHVQGSLYLGPGPERVAHQAVWIKAAAKMPDDQLLHTALLAFASDYSLLESVLRRHGLSWANRGMKTASLDHAMWFHRPVRMDQWLLYVQESPSASGARGMGMGRVFSSDGVLIASTAQEGMMRLPRD